MVWVVVLCVTVLEICCIFSEAQYTYSGGLPQYNDPYQTPCCPQPCVPPCIPTDPCGNSGPCQTGPYASNPNSFNCLCPVCPNCYQNSLPAIINQFSTNFGNLLYSVFTDSQLNSGIPCIVIRDLDTLLANLQECLKEQPRYKSAQYSCMIACLQDQVASLSAEFGCDVET